MLMDAQAWKDSNESVAYFMLEQAVDERRLDIISLPDVGRFYSTDVSVFDLTRIHSCLGRGNSWTCFRNWESAPSQILGTAGSEECTNAHAHSGYRKFDRREDCSPRGQMAPKVLSSSRTSRA